MDSPSNSFKRTLNFNNKLEKEKSSKILNFRLDGPTESPAMSKKPSTSSAIGKSKPVFQKFKLK